MVVTEDEWTLMGKPRCKICWGAGWLESTLSMCGVCKGTGYDLGRLSEEEYKEAIEEHKARGRRIMAKRG